MTEILLILISAITILIVYLQFQAKSTQNNPKINNDLEFQATLKERIKLIYNEIQETDKETSQEAEASHQSQANET